MREDPNQEGLATRAFGSFLGSCSGCAVDDEADVLSCTKCTKPCGAKVRSSIKFSECPSAAFGNNGGALSCEDLPGGTYLRSCRNCQKIADELHCTCPSAEFQGGKQSSIRLREDCGNIINNNGELRCEGDADAAAAASAETTRQEL